MLKRVITWMIGIIVSLLVLTLLGIYLFQDLVIFQSVKLEKDYVFRFDYSFTEHSIPAGDDVQLNALLFDAVGPRKGLILYFHGNRGNLQRWGNYAPDLTKYGYDVLMIDYRGYGKSDGSPSEEALYADASVVWSWVQAKGYQGELIFYGRSLGSAVASQLASVHEPALLILETPFDEIRGVVDPMWLPLARLLPIRSVFSNKEHLRSVKCRKVVLHGTDDRIVPLASAKGLIPLLDDERDFVIIPGGGHRNLRSFPQYQDTILSLLGNR